MTHRGWMVGIALVAALAAGLGAGYIIWGWPTNWYARDVTNLPPSPTNDVILKGHALIVDTATHIGKNAADPQNRYAGNDLACVNCHLDAGLRPFGAPFVSTYASFPMMVDDKVITLKERINGCMIRSMNGKELPADSPEMQAIIAYIKFWGRGRRRACASPAWGSFRSPIRLWRPMPRAGRRSMPISARVATRMTARASPTSRRALAISFRRYGATTASMRRPAWRSLLTPRPMSAPTCRSASAIRIRCSPCSRLGTSRPI